MNFLKIKISDLLPASYNPRKDLKSQDKEYQKIKKSIEEFGYVEPIIINSDNTVIGGHQRLKVLKELGHTEVDVVQINLDKTKEKALNVALNKITGEWDLSKLDELLDDLKSENYDIALTGFDLSELDDLFPAEEKEIEEDDYQVELPEEPKSKVGDVYILGNHRLMCGDSTQKEDVDKLMNGEKADLVLTDPPYNIASHSKNYVASSSNNLRGDISKALSDLANSEWDKNFNIDPALDNIVEYSKNDVSIYVFTSQFLINKIWDKFIQFNFNHVSYCVWTKPNPMPCLSKRHWTWATELCVYATRGKHIFNFPETGHAFNYFAITKKSDGSHPTQKPIELLTHILKHSSVENNNVIDLFGGSGSTLIACEQVNRKCFMMELDPKYVDVIIDRWEKYTGKKAVKE